MRNGQRLRQQRHVADDRAELDAAGSGEYELWSRVIYAHRQLSCSKTAKDN